MSDRSIRRPALPALRLPMMHRGLLVGLAALTALALLVLVVAAGYVGFAIVGDVAPQIGTAGLGGLDLAYLLAPSWTANVALLVATASGVTALAVLRHDRRASGVRVGRGRAALGGRAA